jgi:uncharacterized protein YjiK
MATLDNINLSKRSKLFALPKSLTEASGLTVASPTSVYTHNDEAAIVREVNIHDGRILRTLKIGVPTLRGDFEAVTTSGDTLSLITSDGLIYQTRLTDTHNPELFSIYNTGLRETCEIEGAAADDGGILLLCKHHLLDKSRHRVVIYRWASTAPLAGAEAYITIDLDDLVQATGANFKKPAGLAYDPNSQHLFLLDADQGAVLKLSQSQEVIGYAELPPDDHPQAEGLAIMPNGDLMIVDEGGKKAGRMSVYTATYKSE